MIVVVNLIALQIARKSITKVKVTETFVADKI